VLTNLGARDITQAVDGADAIERLKETEFDLVVTDYNMPHVDGEQLLRYIRNESSQSYVPVLMVTSEQNEATLSSVQKSGVSGLCDKPFDTDNVKQILANLL
jgi:two-component system chemotaxis response regulator CheY